MTDRIEKLINEMKDHDLVPESRAVVYDPMDLCLPEAVMNAKRIIEYIQAQEVYITDTSRFTGMVRYKKAGVPGDIFHRENHRVFGEVCGSFYNRYRENLVVFEWQHSAPNYERIMTEGLVPYLEKIRLYKEKYKDDPEKYAFEEAMEIVVNGVIGWAGICADRYEKEAAVCTDEVRRNELMKVAVTLRKVPLHPAESFYEGLTDLIFCFQFLPDSIGTMDRYLRPLYEKDITAGVITREEAKDLIEEVFVHICNHTPVTDSRADFTAECHFAIGGYTADGDDGFNDLSKLIVESILDMDIRRPSISLRWTKKTPSETLKYMLNCERNDKNKRFAFCSDEPRLKGLQDICHLPYELAVKYTMVGCNEPSFPGTVWYGGCTTNIARSITDTLYNRKEDVIRCETFEEFFAIYCEELDKCIDRIYYYINAFNDMRSKDINVLSEFLLDGCVEAGRSATAGSCTNKIGGFNIMGQTCAIDSLSIVKQYVFDEKKTDMAHLIEVLESDWEKDPGLLSDIINNGRFFGNHDELSDSIAQRFTMELYKDTQKRTTKFGFPVVIGTLAGYNPHFAEYGKRTAATPDGRHAGDTFMVGTGQANGKDRNGILPLMQSLVQLDPVGIMNGPVVCNMLIDAALIKDDGYFDKVCGMIETYFRLGGIHVQLNYVTKEELLAARQMPENYRSLKVRVSGYSASYILLPDGIQCEILERTVKQ